MVVVLSIELALAMEKNAQGLHHPRDASARAADRYAGSRDR